MSSKATDLILLLTLATTTLLTPATAGAQTIGGDTTGAITEREDNSADETITGMLTGTDLGSNVMFEAQNSPGTYGTFTLMPNGAWTYTLDNANPDTNALRERQIVTDTFSVATSDATAETEVVITITGANDAPLAIPNVEPFSDNRFFGSTLEDIAVTVEQWNTVHLDASASYDPEGDPLTYLWQPLVVPAIIFLPEFRADNFFTSEAVSPSFIAWISLDEPAAPGEAVLVETLTLTVSDGSKEATSYFFMRVIPTAPSVPTFGSKVIDDKNYITGEAITPLILPEASGGNGDLTYSLTGFPDGLTFDPHTRTLSGIPKRAQRATLCTYTVTDADNTLSGDTDTLQLTITVRDSPAEGFESATDTILPEIARAIGDQMVSAVGRRIEQAGSGAGAFTLNGQSTLAEALASYLRQHGHAMADGDKNIKNALGDANFVLPLGAADTNDTTGYASLALWGGGAYRDLDGKDDALAWDGDLFSGHLGMDTKLGDGLLAGLMVAWSEGEFDYERTDATEGTYDASLGSFHPYLGWNAPDGRTSLWGTAGYGEGKVRETVAAEERTIKGDVQMTTVGAGGSSQLVRRAGLLSDDGVTTLRFRGEAVVAQMKVDEVEENAEARPNKITVRARRLRLSLEGSHEQPLASGALLSPSAELGLRYDGGDGRTGEGVEVGIGLRYANPARNVTLEGRVRGLVDHSGDYDDWGVQGLILLQPTASGQGLSFRLNPGYGNIIGGVRKIWQQDPLYRDGNDEAADRDYGMRMEAQLGYGFFAPDGFFGGQGVLIPYSEMTLSNGSESYRLGLRWKMDPRFDLNLVGERSENADADATDPVKRAILLEGTVRF